MIKYFFFFYLPIQFIFASASYSQSGYQMHVMNGKLIDDYTYQFDVILNTQKNFEMTSYQCVFSFFCNNMNNDNCVFTLVSGSSQLINKPSLGLAAKLKGNKFELTFASRAYADVFGNNSLRVGTFMVKRKNNQFNLKSIHINWIFSGDNVTIITGHLFSDITNQKNFSSDMMLTDVKDAGDQIPDDFQLEQNYPNPFNPSTKIKFFLKESGKVSLDVYNVLGQKVDEMINEELSSGFHDAEFNANNLSSGIYIYRLNVKGKFTSVRKMILEK